MNLNWFESIVYGLISGFADILPVSAQAHQTLMLKFFGVRGNMAVMELLIHIAVIAALYINCRSQMVRMRRAKALSRVPKKKRKRPLDLRSLMDLRFLSTMLIPAFLGLFLYRYCFGLQGNLILLTVFLLLNGIILYAPQFFPGSNKDSRTLSRVEGLLIGLGSTVSVLPGVSAMGAMLSIGSVCGVERTYCLNMTLIVNLFLNIGFLIYDVLEIMSDGIGTFSALIALRYLLTAAVAFAGSFLGIRLIRRFSENTGYEVFGFYCFGLAMFTFILNLMA